MPFESFSKTEVGFGGTGAGCFALVLASGLLSLAVLLVSVLLPDSFVALVFLLAAFLRGRRLVVFAFLLSVSPSALSEEGFFAELVLDSSFMSVLDSAVFSTALLAVVLSGLASAGLAWSLTSVLTSVAEGLEDPGFSASDFTGFASGVSGLDGLLSCTSVFTAAGAVSAAFAVLFAG